MGLRSKSLLVVVLVVSFCGASVAIGSTYQGTRMLSSLVNDDCVFLAAIPSPTGVAEAMKALGPYRFFHDPEVQAFLKSAETDLDRVLGEVKLTSAEATAKAGKFMETFDKQISLGVILPAHQDEHPDIVVLLESSNPMGAEQWLNEMIQEQVFQSYFGVTPQATVVAGVNGYSLGREDFPLLVCAKGGLLLAASSAEQLAALLKAIDNPPTPSLADNELFKKGCASVGADDAHFLLFLNPGKCWDKALEFNPHKITEINDTRKWLDFEYMAASMRVNGNRAESTVCLAPIPGKKDTILQYIKRQPNPLETMELVPTNAVVFVSAALDLPAVINDLLGNEHALREIASGLMSYQNAQDVAKRKLLQETLTAVAASLKPELSVFGTLPFGGGMFPEGGLIARSGDPAALEQDILSLAKLAGRTPNAVTFMDSHIMVLNEDNGFSAFSPTLGFIGRNAALTFSAQTAKTLARQIQQPIGLLRDADGFKKALAETGQDRVAMAYVDTRAIAMYLYNTINPFLGEILKTVGRESHLNFNAALLPTAQTLSQYFDSLVAGMKWQDETLVIRMTSDGFDPVSLDLHAVVFAPYALPYVLIEARKEMADACRNQLRCHNWINIHGEEAQSITLPDKLSDFAEQQEMNLVCPVDHDPIDIGNGRKSSYEYFPEKYGVKIEINIPAGQDWQARQARMEEFRGILILYDNAPRHMGGRNVLTAANTGAQWMSEEQFQTALKAQLEKYGK